MFEEYERAIASLRKEFVEACRSVFGESLVAIINKGSTVKGGFIPGLSDMDLHVYLKDDAFAYSDFLKLELGLSLQERMDELIRKYDFGGGPVQVIMINVSKPRDWSAPLPGTYLLLYGDECPDPPPTAEGELEYDRANLRNPHYGYGLVNSLADKTSDALAGYVRRLNTAVTPTLYRVLSVFTKDPFKVWKMTRFEVLDALEQLEMESVAAGLEPGRISELGRKFYEIASQNRQLQSDLDLCKEAIRIGFEVLDFGRKVGYELVY
jgi:predicted nucleotidyltransferase